VEVFAKFGGDWHMKEGNSYKQSLLYRYTSQPGPGAAREKFNELKFTLWTLFVQPNFFSSDLFRFWSLGYPGVWGSGWWGHAYVKNLP